MKRKVCKFICFRILLVNQQIPSKQFNLFETRDIFKMNDSFILNSTYHLNTFGVKQRTQLLINEFKKQIQQ